MSGETGRQVRRDQLGKHESTSRTDGELLEVFEQ